ncbi:MAG: Asp-tRNA(Asn)/Glu-tRNA(Gln) amidotransferase subunit GatB [Candidatus Saelkia tenebricola]|nr:Asp-tRNA(Asn)/Glu-tRNA(Gln) amidotransferase subunit GatB [Candidatus Saelkia tenebricola]
MNKFEPVIGLEIHIHLSTESKIFCSCSTKFGNSPNSLTCPICLGLPGVLPVLNKKAFHYAIKSSLALNCQVSESITFDRKNYYYPDLPKNYQISQYGTPVGRNGFLKIKNRSSNPVKINRVHMEEDAGKLIHDQNGKISFVDLNRTGIPLIEIVTEPDIYSPDEAYDFLQELKITILYLEIADCNMEEGSLRCDANISLRKAGDKKLGTKIELKNMNTFKGIRQALEYEIQRQTILLEEGEKVTHQTRLWDPLKQKTTSMRSKEDIHDYRYFPDPDLLTYEISNKMRNKFKDELPELPMAKRERFKKDYFLSEYDADLLVRDKFIASYFEETLKFHINPKAVCNFLTSDMVGVAHEKKIKLSNIKLTPKNCGKILNLVKEGLISIKTAKELLFDLLNYDIDPEKYIEEKNLKQMNETSEIKNVIETACKENSQAVTDYKNGKNSALKFLVGQVMRLTKGTANPAMVNKLLNEKLNKEEGK